MKDRAKKIYRLLNDHDYRVSYVRAKLSVLIPSQLKALRGDLTQNDVAEMGRMKQSRISSMEKPGAVNFNLDTLVRMAATHKVGLVVKFVSYSEMIDWENRFSQDSFSVVRNDQDKNFTEPVQHDPQRFVAQSGQNKPVPFNQGRPFNNEATSGEPVWMNQAS